MAVVRQSLGVRTAGSDLTTSTSAAASSEPSDLGHCPLVWHPDETIKLWPMTLRSWDGEAGT